MIFRMLAHAKQVLRLHVTQNMRDSRAYTNNLCICRACISFSVSFNLMS